jgi:cell wall-associated NlpC family hydrolase
MSPGVSSGGRPCALAALSRTVVSMSPYVTNAPGPRPRRPRGRVQSRHPYVYGADGPRAFDCSGFTKWVFSRMGRHLPRTAAAQSGAVHHVSRAARHRGDLVFFSSGRHVYHVAIYAGHNSVWHSPVQGSA